jgi:hypothetical protein
MFTSHAPCEVCRWRARCADELLACAAFSMFLHAESQPPHLSMIAPHNIAAYTDLLSGLDRAAYGYTSGYWKLQFC